MAADGETRKTPCNEMECPFARVIAQNYVGMTATLGMFDHKGIFGQLQRPTVFFNFFL